jgi:hypothetical protein
VAQRQRQRGRGNEQHRCRGRGASDQAEQQIAAISGGVEDGDAGPDQCLAGARVLRKPAAAPCIFPGADQDDTKRSRGDHSRFGRDELDRVADQEDARRGERDAADPDQQAAADETLEQAGERIAHRRAGCLGIRKRLRLSSLGGQVPSGEERSAVACLRSTRRGGEEGIHPGFEMVQPRLETPSLDEQIDETREKEEFG